MKECEIFSSLKVPCTGETVVRLDGRNFSQLSRKLGFEKPYDHEFAEILLKAARKLFEEFSPLFVYTFSDEVSILLGEMPFAGRIEKLDSIMASFMSSAFTQNVMTDDRFSELLKEFKPISFDSRVIPLSKEGTIKYFQERQMEAWRNCLNGYAYWTLRKTHTKVESMAILHKKKSSQLHELLFANDINLAQLPAWQRRGMGIYKKTVDIEGFNPLKNEKVISQRNKIFLDCNLPLFNKDFFKINELI